MKLTIKKTKLKVPLTNMIKANENTFQLDDINLVILTCND